MNELSKQLRQRMIAWMDSIEKGSSQEYIIQIYNEFKELEKQFFQLKLKESINNIDDKELLEILKCRKLKS